MKHVLATFLIPISLVGAPCVVHAAEPVAVKGIIRDAYGVPQAGALVELLGPRATVLISTLTDESGYYHLTSVVPGEYRLRATAAFLSPGVREHLHLRSGVNFADITLTALMKSDNWLPAERHAVSAHSDDWRWTLRSAANRPLLRLAGTLPQSTAPGVSSSEDHAGRDRSRGELMLMAGDGRFGGGESRQDLTLERGHADGNRSILRASVGSGVPGVAPSLTLGAALEHKAFLGGGTEVFAQVVSHPEIVAGSATGIASLQSAVTETFTLGDLVAVDVGNLLRADRTQVVRIGSAPYLRLALRTSEHTTLEYRMARNSEFQQASDLEQGRLAENFLIDGAGKPVVRKGMHEEIVLSRAVEGQQIAVSVFQDNVPLETLRGGGVLVADERTALPVLYDPESATLRIAAVGGSRTGAKIVWSQPLSPMLSLCVEAVAGKALAVDRQATQLTEAVGNSHLRSAGALAARVQVHSRRSGTEVQLHYRWQPIATLTQVDEYDTRPEDAYLGAGLRQRIWFWHGRRAVSAVLDASNVLAEGYRTFQGTRSQETFLAQVPRSLEGGLAFSF